MARQGVPKRLTAIPEPGTPMPSKKPGAAFPASALRWHNCPAKPTPCGIPKPAMWLRPRGARENEHSYQRVYRRLRTHARNTTERSRGGDSMRSFALVLAAVAFASMAPQPTSAAALSGSIASKPGTPLVESAGFYRRHYDDYYYRRHSDDSYYRRRYDDDYDYYPRYRYSEYRYHPRRYYYDDD